ncbi:MAG: hypothetical protein HC866_11010 [Leptolyngbyaceae cyanobacterium RU_5_1]|nr:hypothetical protein [Leptolyngbyaceae cyanobacterium RU_5_1]
MIISDLNYLEVAEANVEGGSGRVYTENDYVNIYFSSTNVFATYVTSPVAYGNSAAAGAKGDAYVAPWGPGANTYSKADSLAVAYQYGSSFSASTSVAVISPIRYH